MATDLGKVGMRTRGDWSSSATYEVLDMVSYQNGLYIAKQAVPANTLPTNTTYWQLAINMGYPKTAIGITPEEGITIETNRSYRINDIVVIDVNISSTNAINGRTLVGTITEATCKPTSVVRFICPGSATVGGTLNRRTNGFIDTGGKIRVGDDNPDLKDFHINVTYIK